MWHDDLLLAASDNRLSALLRYLGRAGSSRENLIFLLFAVVIATIWLTLYFWDRLRKHPAAQLEAAGSIFDELCQAHRLDRQDIALLTDAALECGLPSPALLFVQPEHLGGLSAEGLSKAGPYRHLRDRLFGPL